ncbi:hypothetical protein VTJ49DRAFT_1621 [Mycothermus thermophilus]|uniref:DUF7905 domain-containing protein n=1 Tax=Humicola insolens TaxID=85995 RepID=A0ABR3VCE1_HUMIN
MTSSDDDSTPVPANPQRPRQWTVTVHVSMPLPDHGYKIIDPSDIDLQVMLSRLEAEHNAKVEIEVIDEENVTITVKTMNRPTAQAIVKSLKRQLQHHGVEEAVWRPHLLIHPPAAGKAGFKATLRPVENTTGKRVTVVDGLESAEAGEVAAMKRVYKQSLEGKLGLVGEELRVTVSGMTMKIRFGTAILASWMKDKANYNFTELESLASRAGPRGTVSTHYEVSETAVRNLIDRLHKDNKALPETVRYFLDDDEPRRRFSIMFDTKNLHTESELTEIQGQQAFHGDEEKPKQYMPGPVMEYRLETRDQIAEVITACPETGHDWAIEIIKMKLDGNTPANAPFDKNELQRSITFTNKTLPDGFPILTIAHEFLRKHQICTAEGKTELRYMLGCRYELVIEIFQEWDLKRLPSVVSKSSPASAAAKPGVTATVTLLCPDWESNGLEAGVEVPRRWEKSNFSEQFLGPEGDDEAPEEVPGTTKDPMEFCLLWVGWILKALDGDPAAGEKKRPGAKN